MQIIGQGAQATLYKVTESQNNIIVIKKRLPKKYRHPELDRKLNESRVKSEAKIIQKLHKKGMNVPRLYKMNLENYQIEMQYLSGQKLKYYLNSEERSKVEIDVILDKLGRLVYRVHELGVIHGDLTTSNMIFLNNEIFLIDFGLSYIKSSIEDKAVDLYVLERAFISTHPSLEKQFSRVLIAYNDEAVLKRLEVVRQRGRKKIAFG